MEARYSGLVEHFQTLPELWLLSDERNDHALEDALVRLPRGSALVYRHYHLPPAERFARFMALKRLCERRDHVMILADSAQTAREWGGDGIYGAPRSLYPTRGDLLTIATVHNPREMALANRFRADAVMLSPAFPTRSHPGAGHLGRSRFRALAALSSAPVIALGGMTHARARSLHWARWAAIDGLS
ncbi:thiamine phosphate synthase [Erythrobacter jejuensis]|uniref:Thiamine phosphate synthase n=2 Tax=Parerythrobacter jejuensis TaxID=795812 RepID=A0A845ARP2_9SPHN|nr:thiamine phosphate synthase [Parerythrobacter jejuensis]MXP33936.1 thiamine phosphate synthase [Parerythrobacter jejuensis]